VLVDTHCHLDFNSFDADRDQVLQRARNSDVRYILNPGINLESSQSAIQLSEDYAEVYAAVGIHPNEALSWNGETLPRLKELAKHRKVKAIGEIGLDYYRDKAPKDLQERIFQEQLDLAAELNLPVVIHSRQSLEDVSAILKDWSYSLYSAHTDLVDHPGVLHSFSGDEKIAQKAFSLNFLIGITGPITFRNAGALRDLVKKVSIENLIIETDAPFLTPHPHRGKRNEPANVRLVAEKIAELRQEAYNNITEITSANAKRLFKW
jgi:TatD DNase family protein